MAPFTTRIALAVGLALATAAPADPVRLFGTNPRTAQRFADAAALETAERWSQAVDLYLRIADDAGDDLIPATAGERHLLPARTLIQRRLAARSELLGFYRDRVEARTRNQLEAANPLDAKALERIVASAFCTRTAEAALHRLGDLACERGDFATARRWWRLLEPPTRLGDFAYPDPSGEPAVVRAKMILARLLAGETAEARAELDAFRRQHGGASGHVAGRAGNLLATLQGLFDSPATRVVAADLRPPQPTTFALDPARNAVLTGRLPPFAPETRYPPIQLSEAAARSDDRLAQVALVKPAALAFHPLVVNRRILVADAVGITAYDLDSGGPTGRLTLDRVRHRMPTIDTKLPSATEVRYTLSASGDRVYGRFGQPRFRADRADAASFLACATLDADGGLTHRWSLPALKADDPVVAVWEGAPVVCDGRLYAAVTRLDGNRAVTAVACYEPSDPQPTLLWQQDVIEAAADAAERTQHLLLTLAGPLVVCGPYAGAVVALDAATGKHAWAARYRATAPKSEPADTPFRELGPCVAAGGVLYAAPSDGDRVYAIDAATGSPLWQSDPVAFSHLLGVARKIVVGQRGGASAGLAALDAATGRVVPGWGYGVFGSDAVAPFGRGLMAEDRVYWPTRAGGVRELRADGTVEYPPVSFLNLPGGNLAYGDGGLVVATEDRLHVLLPPKADGDGPAAGVGRTAVEPALVPVGGEVIVQTSGEPTPVADANGRRDEDVSLALDSPREWALLAEGFDRSAFVVSEASVARRDWPDGREVWSRRLPFVPRWADAVSAVVVVVGGDDAVAGLAPADGRIVWQKRIGSRDLPTAPGWRDRFSSYREPMTLSDFRLRDGTVDARLGRQQSVSFDAATGRLRPADAHRAAAAESAAGQSLTANGRIVVPNERRLIAVEAKTGATVWTHEYSAAANLTGGRPRLRYVNGDILIGLSRNDGYEIDRLEPRTGKPRPGTPSVFRAESFDLLAVAPSGGTLVVAAGGNLTGHEGGRTVWRQPLELPGPWHVEPAGDGTVATWPVRSPEAAPFARWPVLLVSAADGRVRGRWEFGRPGPHGAVRVAGGMLTVATEGEVRRVKLPTRRDDP